MKLWQFLIPGLLVLSACSVRPLDDSAQAGSEGPASTTGGVVTTSGTTEGAPTTGGQVGTSGGSTQVMGDESGCSFVCDPDMGGVAAGQCDPTDVDPCPAGEKCVWYVDPQFGQLRRDAARCIPVTGDGQPFAPCMLPNGIGPEITDDCGAESYCLDVYGTSERGFCAPYPIDLSCAHLPGTELAMENGSNFPYACLWFECNPLVADACPDGLQCEFYPAWLYGVNHCWQTPAVDLPLGAACDFAGCGPGKLCMPAEYVPGCADERCCTAWCDEADPQCADPAATCEHFPTGYKAEDPSFQTLGACVVAGSLTP